MGPNAFHGFLFYIIFYTHFLNLGEISRIITYANASVPTDRRSFRTGPKNILEDRSVQDLKITKRTSKDLFFDPGTIIRFFKMELANALM